MVKSLALSLALAPAHVPSGPAASVPPLPDFSLPALQTPALEPAALAAAPALGALRLAGPAPAREPGEVSLERAMRSAAVFDGGSFKPARPEALPGGTFLALGGSRLDTRAPGAPVLLDAVAGADVRPLLGAFDPRTGRVLNGLKMDPPRVNGHVDVVPPGAPPAEARGYTFFVYADGTFSFQGSGDFFAPITGPVKRAILRYYGLRPLRETWPQRLRRWSLRAVDAVSGLFAA